MREVIAGGARGGPLAGWRVLVPRAAHQAGELAWWLSRYGAVPWEVATIVIEPPPDEAALDRAIMRVHDGAYAWVIFTSVNTVHAFMRRVTACGLDMRVLNQTSVGAVGARTAMELAGLGVQVDLIPDGEESAAGLLRCGPLRSGPVNAHDLVLLPQSDLARDTLLRGLAEYGWRCEPVVAYRTVPAAPPPIDVVSAIEAGHFDAVAFTSSSTVRNLIEIAAGPPPSTVVVAIGRQTARTARELGLRVHATARGASARELAAALAEYAASAGRRANRTPEPPIL